MMRYWMLPAIGVLLLTLPGRLAAQGETPVAETTEEESQDSALAEKLAAMEEELARQQQKIDQIEQSAASKAEELGGKLEAVSERQEAMELAEAEEGDYDTQKKLEIYGFMDLKFVKTIIDEDSPYNLSVPSASSFMLTKVNLYFASQMTETLGALVELRFTFLPNGFEGGGEIWRTSSGSVTTKSWSGSTSEPTRRPMIIRIRLFSNRAG